MGPKLRAYAAFIMLLCCVTSSIAQIPPDKAIDQIIRAFRKQSGGTDSKRRVSLSLNDWPQATKFLKVERRSLPILAEPGLTQQKLRILGIAKPGEIFEDLGCEKRLILTLTPLGGGVDASGIWCKVRLLEGKEGWLFAKPAEQNNWFVSLLDLSPPAPASELSPLFALLVLVGVMALIGLAMRARSAKKEYAPATNSGGYAGSDYGGGYYEGSDYGGADYDESFEPHGEESSAEAKNQGSVPALFGMVKCPDCDGEQWFDPNCGDGKCSTCHGTGGELSFLEGVVEALSELPQVCKTCHGSKKCQTCFGKGYLET